MERRTMVLAALMSMLGLGKGEAKPAATLDDFPPKPKWRPSFGQPIDQVVERMHYYTDGKRDFVVFTNGTCVVVDNGLPDAEVRLAAVEVLRQIFNYHPDMNPAPMDDGNILVRYNHPAFNVVLESVAAANKAEIEARYMDGLTKDEVLFTPLGRNVFDDFGKKALLGRCYFFMDAQSLEIDRIERHGA